MSGSTSVPTIQFTNVGFVAPSQSSIVSGLDADWIAAFNGTLNTAPAEPAGQLITSQAAILGNCNDQQVALYNGIDPAYASGRMQDAIGRIYFLTRNPAQSTVLQVVCVGAVGVVIPVGSLVSDPSGILYSCTGAGTIPSGGSITLSFASVPTGPITVPASVSIYRAIPGWNTATVVSGVVGNLVESRAAFEARREATVAANGAGFLPAIAGSIAKLPGVIDWYVTENYTGSPATIGGVTLAANSLYVCVTGGTSASIAQAIWTKKNPGCAYTGNTTVTVYDTNSGYSSPYPSYSVTYEVPTAEAICFTVSIKNSAQVPSNALTQIQGAINYAFLGEDGGARARIGSTIYASRFYAAVSLLGSWVQLISITMGTNANPTASFTGAISGTTLTTSATTGTIAIGQFVYGANVAVGTYIVSGSGTSWVVSVNQTVSSEAMTSVSPTLNDVTMNINQLPTLATTGTNIIAPLSADISLTLV